MKWFYKIFSHTCQYNETDVIMDAYKDSYYRLYSAHYNGLAPFGWDKVKDIKPRCIHCGKNLTTYKHLRL